MINGLIEPTEGNVYFKQKRVKDYQLQKLRLENWLRVAGKLLCFRRCPSKENIEIIPEMLGWDKNRRNQRVDELLTEVGLEPETFKNGCRLNFQVVKVSGSELLRALAAETRTSS